MIGLGAIASIGMAMYNVYNSQQNLAAETASMDEINSEISGGEEGEVQAENAGEKLTKPGENYLKLAGNKPKPKSGLGFGSDSDSQLGF